ncbi:hypothetical protein BCR33DRAFT_748856 [Rhizoclosmatium globosum]|uniref:Uncharacterized protein n=1 Tax=Rhizoclosmatium globosum TaxID=329046 RepID=A0A1Y2AJG0_9FUNG|nr:hypothetical protein BCR33DRAFT_748856 [Rhizoclosmatium globosum]|eukprot:ORY22681.1 hypothetical protein BCR33DRAFT_748856 [Rhizoclosmatium globosum]
MDMIKLARQEWDVSSEAAEFPELENEPLLESETVEVANNVDIPCSTIVHFLAGLNATKAALQSSKIHTSINRLIKNLAHANTNTPNFITLEFVLDSQKSTTEKRSNKLTTVSSSKKRRSVRDI